VGAAPLLPRPLPAQPARQRPRCSPTPRAATATATAQPQPPCRPPAQAAVTSRCSHNHTPLPHPLVHPRCTPRSPPGCPSGCPSGGCLSVVRATPPHPSRTAQQTSPADSASQAHGQAEGKGQRQRPGNRRADKGVPRIGWLGGFACRSVGRFGSKPWRAWSGGGCGVTGGQPEWQPWGDPWGDPWRHPWRHQWLRQWGARRACRAGCPGSGGRAGLAWCLPRGPAVVVRWPWWCVPVVGVRGARGGWCACPRWVVLSAPWWAPWWCTAVVHCGGALRVRPPVVCGCPPRWCVAAPVLAAPAPDGVHPRAHGPRRWRPRAAGVREAQGDVRFCSGAESSPSGRPWLRARCLRRAC